MFIFGCSPPYSWPFISVDIIDCCILFWFVLLGASIGIIISYASYAYIVFRNTYIEGDLQGSPDLFVLQLFSIYKCQRKSKTRFIFSKRTVWIELRLFLIIICFHCYENVKCQQRLLPSTILPCSGFLWATEFFSFCLTNSAA